MGSKNMTCEGVTKSGSKCKKPPQKGLDFCHLHVNQCVLVEHTLSEQKSTSSVVDVPAKLKYSLQNVAGDGHCFWRALSVCLSGNETQYTNYITKCLAAKSSSDTISKTWVEFHEVPVISRLLGISIAVYFHPRDVKRILNIDLAKDTTHKGLFVYKCSNTGDIDTGPFIDDHQLTNIDANILFVPGHYMAIVQCDSGPLFTSD